MRLCDFFFLRVVNRGEGWKAGGERAEESGGVCLCIYLDWNVGRMDHGGGKGERLKTAKRSNDGPQKRPLFT